MEIKELIARALCSAGLTADGPRAAEQWKEHVDKYWPAYADRAEAVLSAIDRAGLVIAPITRS